VWGESQKMAFQTLKDELGKATKLAYFNTGKKTELYVDASPVGLGAILTQDGRVISYGSCSLSETQQRYSQIEREGLAVVWALEHFHLYVHGKPVTVFTDHKPLLGLFGKPKAKLTPRFQSWALRLQPYEFVLKHKSGKSNPSDYTSRHPLSEQDASDVGRCADQHIHFVTGQAVPRAMTLSEISECTQKDKVLLQVMDAVRTNRWYKYKGQEDMKPFYAVRNELSVDPKSNVLLKQNRIVVPSDLRGRAINIAHEAHMGIVKTKALVREKIWFPGIDYMIEKKIQGCLACQATTSKTAREPLRMTKLPDRPWSEVSIDFFGPLPQGQYLLVVLDDFSRYPEVEITTSTSAGATIPKLDRIFSTHGIPEVVRSDNGPPFQSIEFANFAKHMGFKHRRVTPLWPEANGEVENFMRNLKKVCTVAQLESRPWKQQLYGFLRDYRATPHCSTKVAPATALFNRSIRVKLPESNLKSGKVSKTVIQKADATAKEKMKRYAESRRVIKDSDLSVGDKVLIKNEVKGKLKPKYVAEPYEVVNKKGSMITVRRGSEYKTRNSSKFKSVDCTEPVLDIDDNVLSDMDETVFVPLNREEEPVVFQPEPSPVVVQPEHTPVVVQPKVTPVVECKTPARRYPARVHKKPAYLKDYAK